MTMKTVQVYDKPMRCSTGVCGPQVDPVLPQFAADLDWLKSQGVHVNRFNLAHQPMAFIENKEIHQLLASEGSECLPVILVDGIIVSRIGYPSREVMASWVSTGATKQLLTIAKSVDAVYLREVMCQHASRTVIVPWQMDPPVASLVLSNF